MREKVVEKVVIGLDPGANTGMAIFVNGQLGALITIDPCDIEVQLVWREPNRVVFEDSRLQSHTWTASTSRAAAAKMARNVGEIDAWCKLIVGICGRWNIPCHGISPKGKGKKLNAEQFKAATGWTGASNEHTRDAAMCAWPYRSAA